jgi:adenosine deaminase
LTIQESAKAMSTVVATLPKVDLYRSLAGSFEPALLAELSGRPEDDIKAELAFKDLDGMNQALANVAAMLSSPELLQRAATRLCRKLVDDNVVHTEIHIDPRAIGIEAVEAFTIVEQGLEEAIEDMPGAFLSWSLVLEGRREGDPKAFAEDLAALLQPGCPRPAAIALVGDESQPAAPFSASLSLAADHDLGRVIQAGMARGAKALLEALDLGANRILYGYGALRDDQSLLHLRAHRLPIVVTPSLEEACGKLSSIARHPITKMQDAGLFMTLATGAPGLTGSDMTGELERMSKHLSWRLDAMRNVTGRSIEAAFIVPEGRFTIARAIENWRHRPMLTADNNDDGGYSM